MKVYAIIPVNEWAIEQDREIDGVPALFADKTQAEEYAAELSVDGLEYAAEEVIVITPSCS